MPRAASEVLVTGAWLSRYVNDAESIWQPNCVFVADGQCKLHTRCIKCIAVVKPRCDDDIDYAFLWKKNPADLIDVEEVEWASTDGLKHLLFRI